VIQGQVDELDDSTSSSQSKAQELSTNPSRKRKYDDQAMSKHLVKTEEIPTDLNFQDDNFFPRPTRRSPAKRIKTTNDEPTVLPPKDWEIVYSLTQEMRSRVPAAVDTMGCESLADLACPPRDRRLQTLIALMLSSQTKDPVTAAAIRNMQVNLPGGFNLESLLAVDTTTLNNLICKVGFHNNKTKFIKATAEILRDEWAGDIPDTIEGLVALPGVGPKMAYLTMSAAWGKTEGIGVDVHVHRITNLWGWHTTKTPEQTRLALQAWLPKQKWHEINHLLVGFGQTYCPPVGRKCENCELAKRALCPSAVIPKEPKKKKIKSEIKVEDEGNDLDHAKQDDVEITATETIRVKASREAPPLVLDAYGKAESVQYIKHEVAV